MTELTKRFRTAVEAIPDPPAGPMSVVSDAQMFAYVDDFVAAVEAALNVAVEMADALDAKDAQ